MDSQNRLASLDVFRGVTIAAMILVNNPGSWGDSYPQLKHAAWNGWTMTDMVFPFFLWIMGVAMTLSFSRRRERGGTTKALLLHALQRSVIIFALGILVNGFPFGVGAPFSFSTLRIPGVLQRIAVCYLVVAILFLTTKPRGQLIWAVGVMGVYWLLVTLVPVPGYGQGILQPTGSLCWYVDSTLLAGHTWTYAPAPGFDPEGIISTLPAIASTIFGVLAGHWVGTERTREVKSVGMFVVGYIMVLAGLVADMWLPINKNLWTSSYAVFMGGWALICFSTIYWLMDVKGGIRWLSPFNVFGMNAITLYVVSELLATLLWVIPVTAGGGGGGLTLHDLIYGRLFASWLGPANASLMFAVVFVLFLYAAGWVMWRKGWIIKV